MNIQKATNTLYDIFNSNPLLNLISFLLAVLGLVFTIYFYFKSKKSKLPIYVVRTINLVKEKIQKIDSVQILYSGEKVSNLSISKIAFWNDGKETINSTDVAINNPIKIYITEGYEILDAEILFQKNNSNDFKIVVNENNKSISIAFDFFDFEEGIVLQVFHTGNSNEDISITGTVKSVKNIKRKEILYSIFPSKIFDILKGDKSKIKHKTMRRILGWTTIIVGIIFTSSYFIFPTKHEPVVEDPSFYQKLLPAILGIPYIYTGYKMLKRHIPKGFDIFNDEF
jgi:hypothetical protein